MRRRITEAACCVAYVGLWTTQTLLVRAAARGGGGGYTFDYASMCLLIEALKLACSLLAIALGADGPALPNSPPMLWRVLGHMDTVLYFAVPSLVYCAYNMLQFVNLSLTDAPTFRTLINFKVIFTALFARRWLKNSWLTGRQWVALVLIALGCALAQLDERLQPMPFSSFSLIALQGALGSVGGVYSQWLLQTSGQGMRTLGFFQRNALLYAWGVLVNALYIALFKPHLLTSTEAFFAGYAHSALAILCVGALAGFSTALLLRTLSAVVKELANGAEIVLTAIAANAIYATPVSASLALGAAMVIGALALYEAGARERAATDARVSAAAEARDSRDTTEDSEESTSLLPPPESSRAAGSAAV